MNYRGEWNTTASGEKCIEWSDTRNNYFSKTYTWANLDLDYCRNPSGLQRPFCITEDGRQEECDIIPCNVKTCWDRGPPIYGDRRPNKRFYTIGERVTYTCQEGYILEAGSPREVRCLEGPKSGIWEFDKPICTDNYNHRLLKDLFLSYSANVAPTNVTISFAGFLEQIIDMEEKKEQLVAAVTIHFTWLDKRLKWFPGYYEGIESISIPAYNVWTPPLNLKRNSNPGYQGLETDVPVRLSKDGQVEWSVETLTTTVCDADPFLFPVDTTECHICFSASAAIEHTIRKFRYIFRK
ncbi:neuronal acetylcholine receptor subunit alpha-5-like [Branchiostoma lanceolatum]|uniref:neuronal acetylcholine receptor subunit alpha-5-like n=1 Tax=Branchiostoma lanceolatum TaxID=7740 RepID=UPI0034555B2F